MYRAVLISQIVESSNSIGVFTVHAPALEIDPAQGESYREISGPPAGVPDPNTVNGEYVLNDAKFWQMSSNPDYFVLSYEEL